jgi:hypothetical protein
MSAATAAPRPLFRRVAGVVLVAAFLGAGLWLFRSAPVELVVRFEVSPILSVGDRTIRREALVRLESTLFDGSRAEPLARSSLKLGAGLDSPLTPPIHLRLPRGSYRMVVQLETADGARVVRVRQIHAERDGELRVDL